MSENDIGAILAKLDALSETVSAIRAEQISQGHSLHEAAIKAAVIEQRINAIEAKALTCAMDCKAKIDACIEKKVVLAYLAGAGTLSGGIAAIAVRLMS
jgi:DNA-directed RNA polymerase sigma subunit (sigma70/sigma32)